MKRRKFLSNIVSGGLALSALPQVSAQQRDSAAKKTAEPPKKFPPRLKQTQFRASSPLLPDKSRSLARIGSRSLEELKAHFEKEFGETVSYWERTGVDKEFGGYVDPHYPNKWLYDQGRILWQFSCFYNNFGRKPEHLEAARQGKENLVKYALLPDGHWATALSRDWKLQQGFFDIYADVDMILGLGEYYKATEDKQALDLAVKTAYLVIQTVLEPHYQGQGHGPVYEPGIKRLGTWVQFLSTLTPLLKYAKDEGIDRIARFCVRMIIEKHWNREKGYIYDYLDHEYRPFSYGYLSDYFQDIHSIPSYPSMQAAWMILDEALRVGSRGMFKDGMEMGFDTLSIHWVDGDRCGLNMYENPVDWKPAHDNLRITEILGEAFVFLLMAIEHTHSPLAVSWFERVFGCAYRAHHRWNRSLTLHQPRSIMFSLLALDRMIARKGLVSDFFAA